MCNISPKTKYFLEFFVWLYINPIRSGLFQTANDPGGGALKAPLTISKTVVSIFTLSYICILLGVLGMF